MGLDYPPRPEEIIDDFAFLDGKREEVDLFQRLDLGFFHEATQLGDGNPLLFFPLVATTATASATTTTSATATSAGRQKLILQNEQNPKFDR